MHGCQKIFVSHLLLQIFFKYLLFGNSRHVKGRVLVALADGTLAIFHRGEGKNQRSKRKPSLAKGVTMD